MNVGTAPGAAYQVRLEVFEGPLDLLLHLIRREEMDIHNIPIARITGQYLEYIETLSELDLDRASEFLLMAATLMDIKSRTLLPRPKAGEFIDAEAQEDPRAELVARLLEYRRYKEAAGQLAARAERAARRHSRYGGPLGPAPPLLLGAGGSHAGDDSGASPQGDVGVGLTDLVAALRDALREVEERAPGEIARETVSVADKLAELVPMLLAAKEKGLDFLALLRQAESRRGVVMCFLALLELVRQGRARFAQEVPFGPITVWAVPGTENWGWPGRG